MARSGLPPSVVAVALLCVYFAGIATITMEQVPMPPAAPVFHEGERAVVFVGHATTLIRMDGLTLLTDPNLNARVTIMGRSRAPGLTPDRLPPIDLVLISHAHRDHLDPWTLRNLSKGTTILISKGNGSHLRDLGFTDVHEVEPWETTTVRKMGITAVPAKHSGARNSPSASWPKALGFVVSGSKTVYFAGDTGLSDAFREIGRKFQIDVALLPIGAYRPYWFMKGHHLDPADAVEAFRMLGARHMIPIHWGSFRMALEPVDEPAAALRRIVDSGPIGDRVHVLGNGEHFRF